MNIQAIAMFGLFLILLQLMGLDSNPQPEKLGRSNDEEKRSTRVRPSARPNDKSGTGGTAAMSDTNLLEVEADEAETSTDSYEYNDKENEITLEISSNDTTHSSNDSYEISDSNGTAYNVTTNTPDSNNMTEASKSNDEVTEASKPTYEVSEASKPTYEVSEASNPSYEVNEASKPSYEVNEASKPSYEVTEASKPTYEVSEASKPTYKVTDASKSTYEVTEASKPTYEIKESLIDTTSNSKGKENSKPSKIPIHNTDPFHHITKTVNLHWGTFVTNIRDTAIKMWKSLSERMEHSIATMPIIIEEVKPDSDDSEEVRNMKSHYRRK